MRPDDFFVEQHVSSDPLFGVSTASRTLDLDLLTELRRGPIADHDDVEVAVGLARLVHDELEKYGTEGGQELTEHQIRESLLTLHALVRRAGIGTFDLPFRDYGTFKSYWKRIGCTNSYRARRDVLNDLLCPLHDQLTELEARSLSSTLAQAISPHPVTGWASVDKELAELRRHFQIAKSEQDYRNIGNDCVTITEALSRHVYDPQVHLRPDEDEPPVTQTKNRIDRYIEDALAGPQNADLRRLAKSATEFAQRVKHNRTSTRRDAGIAADAVILLAHILRRLEEPA